MMLTVLEAISSAAEYLGQKGIESARLNSELLLAQTLHCKRLDLYLTFERPLQKNEIDTFRDLIKRRSKFEPLQYIIGKVEFFGIELEIDSSVLIPRPETELLVETVLGEVKNIENPNILDIGSGSGNISIALAKSLPRSHITGIDISEDAIIISKRNAKIQQVEKQVMFVHRDIFSATDFNANHFDVIVSNPPYIPANDFEELAPELRLYEPKIALTDGDNGLNFYKKISSLAKILLKKNGMIFFEIGINQSESVKTILSENSFLNIAIKKDYSDIDRIIFGVKN